MVKSNYEILGVPENASRNEIRTAFRNLALTHHADRGGQDEEFIIIKQAFEDLKSGGAYLSIVSSRASTTCCGMSRQTLSNHLLEHTMHICWNVCLLVLS